MNMSLELTELESKVDELDGINRTQKKEHVGEIEQLTKELIEVQSTMQNKNNEIMKIKEMIDEAEE